MKDGFICRRCSSWSLSQLFTVLLLDMAKKPGLWANIHAKRKRGEAPAKKGDKNYPETLDIGEGMKKARENVGADKCWDGYKAKGTKKKDGKEVPNCVKEAKTFAEFCAEGKSRIETDPEYRKRFKALADNFAEKRKEQAKAKMKKESVEILDANGNMFAEVIDLIKPEPMTGWKQQNEDYKKLPKRKMGMKAGKKIISAVGHAGKAGAEDEGTIEDQIRMQKAGKKAKQADKMHKVAGKHNETLSRMKSMKNKLKGLTKEEYVDEAAWTKKAGKSEAGGLNEKGRKSYERENPGSDLKAPSKKVGNKRRASFCARMKGMRKRQKPENNTGDDRLSKSLKAWNC